MGTYTDFGYFITRCARQFGDRIALTFEGQDFTYRDLDRRSTRMANAFVSLGVRSGNKVASLLPNCHQAIETYFALAKAGAVSVQLNPRLIARELRYILDHADAMMLVYSADFERLVEEIRPELPNITTYIRVGALPPRTLDFDSLIASAEDRPLAVDIQDDDPCTILYTSGTTGGPKGVLRSHKSNLWAAYNGMMLVGRRPDDVELYSIPAFGVGFFNLICADFAAGARVLMTGGFDPAETLRIFQEQPVSIFYGVPTMWNFLLEVPVRPGWRAKALRVAMWGGEPTPAPIGERIIARFGPVLAGSFGQTEGGLCFAPPAVTARKLTTAGRPAATDEVSVVDAEDRELPRGTAGEIVLRGPSLMQGYYKNPEATEETLRNGWSHTGDIGWLDAEGDLFIAGRKKDMVISGGENIYPAEIEQVLLTHPKILEAAVIGVPDERWGEAVTAIIVTQPDQTLDADEVIAFARRQLAGYKKPKHVRFVDSLPKNASGKIMKGALRELYGGNAKPG